jgi:mono/diheme cytochrome c family protein
MPITPRFRFLRPGLAVAVLAVCTPGAFAADTRTGEQVYRKQCASCHGANGEGAKAYPRPLAGDKPLPQLTKVIVKTMPEDDPGSLPAAEFEAVSKYVFDSFYSKEARARNPLPRIELSHLTVRQYRNAVADLVGSFRGPAPKEARQGLRGEYFDARNIRQDKRVIDRVDPEVSFHFGTAGPDGKTGAHEFAIRWEGSVVAPETGDYEFVVRTDHATRMWVNDPNKPLLDAWVKSGSDVDHGASIFLLAGRPYFLRLEFSKADQGVKKEKKGPPSPAMVALLWKRPRCTPEVIPARHLVPAKAPEEFVSSVPFPADDRSLGWERGSAVSKAWDAATTDAALEAAAYVAAHLNALTGLGPAAREPGPASGNPASIRFDPQPGSKVPADERARKARELAEKFVERAFRRPLTPDLKKVYIDRQFEQARDPELAIKRVVLLTLKSPRFLYKEGGSADDPYDTAERLAFALWDSLPDLELLDAAAAGKLANRDEVTKQATRMLADPRAKAKLRDFLFTWLKVDPAPDLAKDAKKFPGFNPAVATDLRTSLELTLDEVVWGEASDFRQLLLSDEVYLNGRLATFYGIAPPPPRLFGVPLGAEQPFKKVKLDAGRRAGVLTHPYLMAGFAYTGSSSPIHRGVFLARGVLGRTLRPPQDAFTPLPEDLHPTLTTRERVALQTKGDNCQACHGMINPLGFTLENFDAVGRYRDKDNGKAVDATGTYLTRTGDAVTFHGARDLAEFLVKTEEVQAAFADRLFHHLAQQPVQAYGPGALEKLRASFAASGFNVRKLAVEIAVSAALPPEKRKPSPAGG